MRRRLDERAPPGSAKTRPKVELDSTVARLERLALPHAAERLAARLAEATKSELAHHGFLDRLLDDEHSACEERRVRTALKLSGLPTGQTLRNFDFAFQPSVEWSRIETLATCAWLRAVENGFSVIFYRLGELLAALRRDADLSPGRLAAHPSDNRPFSGTRSRSALSCPSGMSILSSTQS